MFQKHKEKQEGKHQAKSEEHWWHYLAVKILSALLRAVTSKNNGDFYCLNCLHSFRTKNKPELLNKICENKDFCNVVLPWEDTNILEFNQYQKFAKLLFVIYADLECITENIDGHESNNENSSTTKVSKHIPSGFSMSTICSIRWSKDYMKKFCESLGEHTMKIILKEKENEVMKM